MSEAADFWQRPQVRVGFDGVYRPEPFQHHWHAAAYTNDGKGGQRHMDDTRFRLEEEAQARCDELNATREAVSLRKDRAKRPETLF